MRTRCGLMHALALAAALAGPCAQADTGSLAPFSGQSDIGAPRHAGNAAYAGQRFIVQAGGTNMMGAHDEFHFVWRRMTGDFTLDARVAFAGPGVQAHRKAGLMARTGLGDGAAYVDAAVHGDGPDALQLRAADGGQTEMQVLAAPTGTAAVAKQVRLERHGQRFTVTIAPEGGPAVRRELSGADLPDTLYVGLFVCAHDADAVETALFDGVRLGAAGQHSKDTMTTGDKQ